MDMRGYGDSDKPAALEDYKMPRLVDDIKEIIEALGMYVAGVRMTAEEYYPLQKKLTAECKILYRIIPYCTVLYLLYLFVPYYTLLYRIIHYCTYYTLLYRLYLIVPYYTLFIFCY